MSKSNEFNYGGQAVIEGVMMRGAKTMAVAVRNPAGDIVVHTEPLNQHIYGGRVARLPFLRGLTLLWDALGLGIKSLMFSANVALEEENGNSDEPQKIFQGPAEIGTILFSLSLSIGLFFVLPAVIANLVEQWTGITDSRIFGNFVEGMVRLVLLVGYIWIIGFLPDVKRLYGYHGAEHKTINAYEAGAELTPASVARFPLEHPRCGTAFLLTVVLLSILLYTLLPPMGIGLRIATRLLFLPIIAGMAYEFLRFSAVHQDNALIRFITKPNLALQSLTTREPDEGMLAVAISAFEQMRAAEQGETGAAVSTADVAVSEAI
ncbi:MAG: DUF1385 domain-containing protein [Ardenticatenaceae bacterium]|nr:DUF1385 domain-containing protein [Ardenticatenaceae bacterium]